LVLLLEVLHDNLQYLWTSTSDLFREDFEWAFSHLLSDAIEVCKIVSKNFDKLLDKSLLVFFNTGHLSLEHLLHRFHGVTNSGDFSHEFLLSDESQMHSNIHEN
jgi:hypothetical protein